MNVNIFLLAVISVAAARPNPKTDTDGVSGVIYDTPDYADPDLAMFQLSALKALPILSFLGLGGEPEDTQIKGDKPSSEEIDDVKTRLEEVISRLDMAISKLDQGDKYIFTDIDKSIYNLKNLQRHLQRDSNPVRVSLRKAIALIGKKSDLITTDKDEYLAPLPIIGSSDMITVYPLPEKKVEIIDSGDIPCSQNSTCTEKPQPENPPPVGITLKIPLNSPTLMTETDKYEDAGKAIFRKKWTWKSSSIV